MTKSRLSLCVLAPFALVLTALVPGIVQAETGAKWNVVNAKGELVEVKSGGLSPTIRLTAVEAGERLLTEVAGIKIEKKCSGYELLNAKLEGEGKISSGAKVRFTGCSFFLNGKVNAACEPHTNGQGKGVLESTATKGLLVLHKLASGTLDPIVRIEPVSGETFMVLETGEECAIGEKMLMTGVLTLKDCENALTTLKVVHLVEEGPLTEMWFLTKTPEHLVRFDGSATGELSGEHKGLKVSGTPG